MPVGTGAIDMAPTEYKAAALTRSGLWASAAAWLRPGARGPAAGAGPHPGRLGPCFDAGPNPLLCARLSACGLLFAHSGSPVAPGPLPLRGSPPARRARPCRAPLFRGPPALALGLLCAAVAAPRALAGPGCLWPRPCCAAGSLFGCPCCARPWALCSAWPRRAPPRAPRWPASGGPAAAPPPLGLRVRGAPARGPARAAPACSGLRPPGFCCAPCARARLAASGGGSSGGGCSWAALLGLRVRCWLGFAPAAAHRCSPRRAAAVVAVGFSPASPPAPAAPSGGSRGARGLRPWGLPPPALRASPLRRCCFRSVQNFGLLGLDFPDPAWYAVLARPVPLPFGGCPWRGVSMDGRRSSVERLGFFSALFSGLLLRQNHRSDFCGVNCYARAPHGLCARCTFRKL